MLLWCPYLEGAPKRQILWRVLNKRNAALFPGLVSSVRVINQQPQLVLRRLGLRWIILEQGQSDATGKIELSGLAGNALSLVKRQTLLIAVIDRRSLKIANEEAEIARLCNHGEDLPQTLLIRPGYISTPDNSMSGTSSAQSNALHGRQTYIRHGWIHFTVDGQEVALTVYWNGHGYFLPFADALAGTETYGAGRYLPTPSGRKKQEQAALPARSRL